MPYLGPLWLEFEEIIVIFEISTLKFVKLQNFTKKLQNAQIWDQNSLISVLLGQKLKKLLSYMKSAISNFIQ